MIAIAIDILEEPSVSCLSGAKKLLGKINELETNDAYSIVAKRLKIMR